MIYKIFLSILIFSNLLIFANVNSAIAEKHTFEQSSGLLRTGGEVGYFSVFSETADKTLPEIIGLAVQAVLALLGVFFLILMIIGGYIWMMARGNEQEIEKAKKIIQNAIIGLIIVVAAYAITWTIYLLLPILPID